MPDADEQLSARRELDPNAFAFALYGVLRGQQGNLFCSPKSLRIALAMTCMGARGETAAEMRSVLGISGDAAKVGLPTGVGDAGSGMVVANSLWSQFGAPLRSAYIEAVARQFDGEISAVDFRQEADVARVLINRWIAGQTKGKIREMLQPGTPSEDTRLLLVNAVHFKAPWDLPFEKRWTHDERFFRQDGEAVVVPLMHQFALMGYLKGPDFQAVILAYQGEFSMVVLLPARRDGLPDLEAALSAALIRDCLQRQGQCKVKLFLPRFKFSWGPINLRDALVALGMKLAFAVGGADFSGINGLAPPHEESLVLSSVVHKAFVEVTEEGTEAAAASAMNFICLGLPSRDAPPIPVFRADHPFLFAICDRRSGAVLFLGRVTDPVAAT